MYGNLRCHFNHSDNSDNNYPIITSYTGMITYWEYAQYSLMHGNHGTLW